MNNIYDILTNELLIVLRDGDNSFLILLAEKVHRIGYLIQNNQFFLDLPLSILDSSNIHKADEFFNSYQVDCPTEEECFDNNGVRWFLVTYKLPLGKDASVAATIGLDALAFIYGLNEIEDLEIHTGKY